MDEFANYISGFIIHWTGLPVSRIVLLSIASLLLVTTLVAIWNKKIRILSAVICLATGTFLLVVAVYPGIVKLFIQIDYINRVRIAIGILSLVVLIITFEALRMTKMQERYALLWVTTGIIILVFALMPHIVYMIGKITGMEYVNAIVTVIITFLLLVAFHFSVAMSQFQSHQSALAQQQAVLKIRVEVLEAKLKIAPPADYIKQNIDNCQLVPQNDLITDNLLSTDRKGKAVRWASIIVIGITVLALLGIGIATPLPMIGDEVTHYYMLQSQIERLPSPNIISEIPLANGSLEIRKYPHVFMWHYLGAIIAAILPSGVRTVQCYHTMYVIQLLVFGYLTLRLRNEDGSIAPLVYLLFIISIPMFLIFSVTFYQDIPLAAQIVTAVYFLQRRKIKLAALFLSFSLTLKVTAILFLPTFIFIVLFWDVKRKNTGRLILNAGTITVLVLSTMLCITWSLKKFGDAPYYPFQKAKEIAQKLNPIEKRVDGYNRPGPVSDSRMMGEDLVSKYEAEIIANHPGDLRSPENFFIYGGGLFWLIILLTVCYPLICMILHSPVPLDREGWAPRFTSWWIWALGGSFILLSYIFLRTAPDARFFLPGVILILIPMAELIARLPHKKKWLPILIVIASIQTGMVLKKVYNLRKVSPEITEAIDFLRHDDRATRLFMYPEGNYRLFPKSHEWYLNYKLREFWRGKSDFRIKMLNEHGVNTIVIKKHLIASVSDAITNLGVYPDYFVKDLKMDDRFKKIFENDGVIIYRVPEIGE